MAACSNRTDWLNFSYLVFSFKLFFEKCWLSFCHFGGFCFFWHDIKFVSELIKKEVVKYTEVTWIEHFRLKDLIIVEELVMLFENFKNVEPCRVLTTANLHSILKPFRFFFNIYHVWRYVICNVMLCCDFYSYQFVFPGKSVISDDFDLSIMLHLLCTLANIEVSDLYPVKSDKRISAMLSRIKYIRNEVTQLYEGRLSENHFNIYWDDIAQVRYSFIPLQNRMK